MEYPNFFIIGAMKAGTTALYYFSKQNPEIFMSPMKEPNFFCMEWKGTQVPIEGDEESVTDYSSYLKLYDGARDEKVIGEASHSYLYFSSVSKKLSRLYPDARIVCILRDPVDRAYSHYLYHMRDGREPIAEFKKALIMEDTRIENNIIFGHYIRRGLYYAQIKRYVESFDWNQIKIFLYDDLKNEPLKLIADMYSFLEVDNNFEPEISIIRNPSGIPKNRWMHKLLVYPNPIKSFVQPILPGSMYRLATRIRDRNLNKPILSSEFRSDLKKLFKEDILHLQDLIHRDLSAWLA